MGSSALLSRFLGENNRERVGSVAIHGIVIAGITYVVFALLGLLFTKNYALHQGQNPVVTEYTKEYLYIVTIFSIGIFFQTLAEKLLQATSLTKYTMITQMSGAILNIILDPILIFGLFGFPRLEVKGAAIATVIGQVFGAIVGFYFNKNKNHDIKFTSKRFKFHGDIVKQIFWIGLPTIVMNTIGSLVVFALNTILKNFGSSAIASYGVMFKFQSFAFLPVFGISNALTTIVSYNYGAKKKDRIKESIGLSIKSSFVLMAIAVVIMWLFPKQLLAMFNATDNMLEIGVPMMRIVSLSYLVAVPAIVSVGGVFQSLGNWQIAIFQSFLRQFIILIPIFNLLSKTGSLNVAWWAFFIAEFTNSILCMFILRKEIKTKIDIL